jgi:hypothetical protein
LIVGRSVSERAPVRLPRLAYRRTGAEEHRLQI